MKKCFVVVAFFDLANIAADIDTGGAGALTGGCTLIGGIFIQNAPACRGKGDNILGADIHTGTATDTALKIYNRQIVVAHAQGIEWTGVSTGTQTNATNGETAPAAGGRPLASGCLPPTAANMAARLGTTVPARRLPVRSSVRRFVPPFLAAS